MYLSIIQNVFEKIDYCPASIWCYSKKKNEDIKKVTRAVNRRRTDNEQWPIEKW
jgi:hypothetical protein